MGSVTTETDLQATLIGFRLINVMFNKNFSKNLTAIKLNSFQWKSINTLSYATIWVPYKDGSDA